MAPTRKSPAAPRKPSRKTSSRKGGARGAARPKARPRAAKGAVPAPATARAPAREAKAAAREPARKARAATGEPARKAKAPARKKPARSRVPRRPAQPPPSDGLDPEGHFIARVRGEEAARQAPHPMTETDDTALAAPAASAAEEDDEGLGELPWGYGDDALVALPRDPRTLFLYWCHARETVARAFAGIDRARVQLRVFAGIAGEGWEQVRAVDCALESRGYYVHDLEPGRLYRAEIHVVGRGTERPLGAPSNEVRLPPSGPSPLVDDRFARIPWELPLDRWVRDAEEGGAFPDDLREHLAHLSGGPGEPGGRAPGAAPGVGTPSSPVGGWGGGSGTGREGR